MGAYMEKKEVDINKQAQNERGREREVCLGKTIHCTTTYYSELKYTVQMHFSHFILMSYEDVHFLTLCGCGGGEVCT